MADFTDEEWEELGRKWREAAGMDHDTRINAPEFVRWLKRAGYIKDYVRVPDRELPTADGKYDPDQGIIFYRQSTWNAAERGESRAIWSLIHEASHVVLKHKELRFRSNIANTNRLSRQTNKDEVDTNRLTASILAPFDKADFDQTTTVDDLRRRFGLGAEAATRRLEEFRRLFRRQHGIRRALPPGIIDFLAEQRRKGYRVKSLDDIEVASLRVQKPYEGDPCPCCKMLTLVRNGLSLTCDTCGTRTGDD